MMRWSWKSHRYRDIYNSVTYLPDGWRWLEPGEWVEYGDVVCDLRGKPVMIEGELLDKGENIRVRTIHLWKMTRTCHPVRRRTHDGSSVKQTKASG